MKNQKGFTLIELLVVIAIIGLLSTLAVVSLNNARQKARDAKRVADVRQIQTALELYFNEHNAYPLMAVGDVLGLESIAGFSTYMADVPANPSPQAEDYGGTSNCPGEDYQYESCTADGTTCNATVDGASYYITYCLSGTTGNLNGGKHIATPAGM
ncbi:MAG: type II secretion system protein [Patescibacteria group bacterium]|nr:type II secretion system protein [Patescibacteria group bacterium]